MTGTVTPLWGSTISAKPNPINSAMECPPFSTALNTRRTANPMAMPMSICCTVTIPPARLNGVTVSTLGIIGTITRVKITAIPSLTRIGTL